ncbi:lysylphosphatidylglycerol synthase transmembrane domain-containing protein [soil metagenome]
MSSKKVKKDIKFWVNVFTIVALLVLVVISRTAILAAFKKLGQLNAAALLLMIPLQLVNYYSVARLYKDYFKTQGEELKLSTMYSIALELNFVNHVFPSGGVSGFSYLSLRLKQEGISAAKSTLAQIVRFALTFISFLALLFLGMLILALRRHTSPLTILVSSSIAFLTLFGVIIGTYIISDEGRIKAFTGWLPKALNRIIGVFRRHKKETINIGKLETMMEDLHRDYTLLSQDWRSLKKPLIWALLINVTDVATIYAVYMAFGSLINPGALIIAYAVANFAGLVAILPGGVGIYEGLMTATLTSAGVDKALALSATVVYRVLNMLYALPIGYYLYQRALKRSGIPKPETEGSHLGNPPMG